MNESANSSVFLNPASNRPVFAAWSSHGRYFGAAICSKNKILCIVGTILLSLCIEKACSGRHYRSCGMKHVDIENIINYLDGQGTDIERSALETHCAACQDC